MSISYVENIPAATHNPSADQPNMQINNNAIQAILGIDHVPFNVGGEGENSGQHQHVTFGFSQTVPALSSTPPATQIYPKTFGTTTTYLETYISAKPSAGFQIDGYLPFVKAIVSVTGVPLAVGGSSVLTPTTNAIKANINTVVQTRPAALNNLITITFTNALPYNAYYVFVSPDSLGGTYTLTRGTATLVLTSGQLATFSGVLFQIMVI